MAILGSGVLLNLLEETKDNKKPSKKNRKHVLLQIRSIVPVLAEDDDLWPKQGFHLKVADSSHSMYVSLPHEHDNMVFCNELQLGQMVFVQMLERGHPVPVLRGIRPVPGRHPCVGNPENLDLVSEEEKGGGLGKKPQEKIRSLSSLTAHRNGNRRDRMVGNFVFDGQVSDLTEGFGKTNSSFVDKDCDSDSTISSSSSANAPTVKRRSWNGAETSDSPPVPKPVMKPTASSRSASASPIRSTKCDSSNENSSSKTKRKSVKNSNKSVAIKSMKESEMSLDQSDEKLAESKIIWNSLPSDLVKLGKEVLRQRDMALLASVEALQEASAAERLLKCLSIYSKLQSSKGKEQQPLVNTFFDLQEDFAYTSVVLQSLTKISPLRANDNDLNSHGTIRETLKLAVNRKKNATLWIKAALASDLTPLSAPSFSTEATNEMKRTSTSYGNRPKGSCIVRKQKKNGNFHIGFAAEEDNLQDWMKGSALVATTELTKSLNNELRRWFLAHAESYLDEVMSKAISVESDNQVAEMMCRIKKVNDCLDVLIQPDADYSNLRIGEGSMFEDSELETCRRVKNKIYGVLLKHVERTAKAWEHVNTTIVEDR
ncbi:hypothetical protein UlMin_031120 [Ulmus minor]